MEQDINELKRLLYSDRLTQYGKRKLIEYYEKQIEEQNNIIETANIAIKDLQQKLENSIPVSLVEEKIEELKEEIEQLRIERNVTYDSGIYKNQIKIDILQELLEKRK